MSRKGRVQPRAAIVAALLAVSAGCADVDVVTPAGATVVRGALRLRPVRFATEDYYLRPSVVDAEEGWLDVPAVRGRGDGGESATVVRIHWVRLPATTRTKGAPIVYLAGGPGGSGVRSAAGDRFPLFDALRETGDVIALDQRGAYGADPTAACPGRWSYPLDRPLDPATLARVMAPYLRRCAAYWSDSVPLAAFSTAESAEDLESLRLALGAERLRLLATSYGTQLALAYMRSHPGRVERAVLAGVEGTGAVYKLPAAVDTVVMRLDSAMRADPRLRRELSDPAGAVRAALARLASYPSLPATDPRTGEGIRIVLGPLDLQRALYFGMREHETIEEVTTRLLPVLRGDYAPLARFALLTRLDNTESAMAISMDCASGVSLAREDSIRRQGTMSALGDVANLDLRAACASWPVPDLGERWRSPVRSEVPTLFVSGSLDPRTPPSGAEALLPGFPRGAHLVVDGGGHDDDLLITSAEVRGEILGFLGGGVPESRRIALAPLRFRLP